MYFFGTSRCSLCQRSCEFLRLLHKFQEVQEVLGGKVAVEANVPAYLATQHC